MKKFIFNRFTLIIFLLLLFIFISALSYATKVSAHLSDNVFRLHVIANSDSDVDQSLKYKVRDAVIEYMKTICSPNASKDEYILCAKSNLENIKQVAKDTVTKNGYNYDINVSVGNFEFPTKKYGDISFPTGFYDALRVEIGNANGQNWWCVMFPPLCFVDVSSGIVPEESKETLQDNISAEEYNLITASNTELKFKFKLVEMFNNWGLVANR